MAVTTVGFVAVPTSHAIGGTISGVVLDTAGNPIPGATVYTQRQPNEFFFPNLAATTDASGTYTISGLGPNSWKVVAFAPGFAIRWGNSATFEAGASVAVVADEPHTFDITLPRADASIAGRVTDPSGNPMAGVVIRADYRGSLLPPSFLLPGFSSTPYFRFATTDADGRYVMADMAPTVFAINFSSFVEGPNGPPLPSPYLEEWYPDNHDAATAAPIQLTEGTDTVGIDAQLDLGGTINGRITDPDGNPVGGASVFSAASFAFGGTLTDADGAYSLIGIPPGDVAFVAASSPEPGSLAAWYGGANADTAAHVQVGLGEVIDGIDIQLPTPGDVNIAVFRPDGSLAPSVFMPCIAPAVPVVVPSSPLVGMGPQVRCSAGGKVTIGSSPSGGLRIPVGTYNAISAEGAGAFGVTTLNPSGVASFTLTAGTPLDCIFHLGGTASCSPSDPATNDGDGLAAVVEDAAPNSGDGNSDGIRDAEQSNVASLPAAVGGGYVTLVVPDGQRISRAFVSRQVQVNQAFETGEIGIIVNGVAAGDTADISILRTVGGAATELWAFNHQTFKYTGVAADFNGSTITAHIVDGGPFDNANLAGPFVTPPDGAVSSFLTPVISDHVPPVVDVDSTPPTVTCPSTPSFLLNQPGATLSASVFDGESGVAAATATVSLSTSALGTRSVNISAGDLSGNTTSVSCTYKVGVRLDRLRSPNRAITTKVKAGRSIPVRWRVVDFYRNPVTDPNHFLGVTATTSSCVKGRTDDLDTVRARGLRYLGNGLWQYDWTAPAKKGCYTLQLSLTGASATARIRVK